MYDMALNAFDHVTTSLDVITAWYMNQLAMAASARWRRLVPWAGLLLIFLVFVFVMQNQAPANDGAAIAAAHNKLGVLAQPALTPTIGHKHGTTFLFQLPASPRAVLFLAHGCNCKATFFWDRHPSCPQCLGLPEERVLVLKALARGYAVIAISSTARCWNPHVDTEKVVSILGQWIKDNGLDGVPILALGASSGGYFVSSLALKFRFKSIVVMIAEGNFEFMEVGSDYPPTLFVHMPRDEQRARGVSRSMELLRGKGVSTGEIQCSPVPITPWFFAERIPRLDRGTSEKIYAALKDGGIVDEHGLMQGDGRAVDWQLAVRKHHALPAEWENHIQEELNLAYAYHEMTSLPAQDIFKWFDQSLPQTPRLK